MLYSHRRGRRFGSLIVGVPPATGIVAGPHISGGGTDNPSTGDIDTTGMNLIVAGVNRYLFGAGTFADSKGNVWQPLTERYTGNSFYHRLYYCLNPTVGPGHNFGVAATGYHGTINILTFSGVLDYQAESGLGSNASVNSIQPGSLTPTTDGALIVTGLCVDQQPVVLGINQGFTIRETAQWGAFFGCGGASLATLIQNPKAAVNPTWSLDAPAYLTADMAVFRAA